MPSTQTPNDLRRRLLRWYDASRRDLPWRVAPGSPLEALPLPYHVFVSEAMLQQTQVATVVPYFHRFIRQFPDFYSLAAADEQAVLRAWQGLGYYSRARNLRKAARVVVEQFAGILPRDAESLRSLPGVGPYTAGAVASLSFNERAAILDGNVARVLCRVDAIEQDPRGPETLKRLWTRSLELLPAKRTGDFNSALMELGATVCLPRNPQCLICPITRHCRAYQRGLQDRIPRPRIRKQMPLHRRIVVCIRDPRGRILIEQRPAKGRWGGLWQFPTLAAEGDSYERKTLSASLNFEVRNVRQIGKARHALTHRRYEFTAFSATAVAATVEPRRWVALDELDRFPMSKPQLAIAKLLAADL